MATKNRYTTIYASFREDILNGKYSHGSLLPPESDVAEKMSVSRPTIAKVYNTLQNEGYIYKKPGFGTTVIYSKDKKKYTFGLLLPGSSETEIFRIINDQFLSLGKEKDFVCLWEGTVANNAEVRKEMIKKVCQHYLEKNVDGVFFSPLERTEKANILNEEICNLFDSKNIPVVLIDRDIYLFPNRSKYDLVGIDNYQAGYVMAQHLIKAGCTNVNFFCRRDSAATTNMRIAGCEAAALKAGIRFDKDSVFEGEPNNTALVKKIAIVKGKTGIVCSNDSIAAVLMSSLTDNGYKIGHDLVISGIDDMKYAKHLQVPLTTYRQPVQEIGRVSVEVMLNRLQNINSEVALTVALSGKLVVRESSRFK